MTRPLLLLLFLLATAGPAWAALPPLSDAERQAESEVIVRGEIMSIEAREKLLKAGSSNLEMILTIKIKECLKGGLEVGSVVMIQCWVAQERPEGWAGDGGQRPKPLAGDEGTFYAKDRGGKLHLLHPNGWDAQ
ncbi:MAG: hypothetical protein KC800_14745 [Candidatus Eremiobacteraeota bacterium]|nr:hypothetical protein [Candidatus Eremiobacteraeota bacterium]